MKLVTTSLTSALIILAFGCQTLASERVPTIDDLVAQIESAENERDLRAAMRELATIGDAKAATVFVDTMETKILSKGIRLMPYLAYINEFDGEPATGAALSSILRRLDSEDLDQFDRVYVAGSLAKYGDSNRISWLIDRYMEESTRLNGRSFSVLILKTMSKVNQERASNFVLDRALESEDPALKLSIEQTMRSAGNPRAIDLMRRWDSVETREIDLIVVEHYLKSIIAFGDIRDREFIDWLEKNGSGYLPNPEYEQDIIPMMNEASLNIDSRMTKTRGRDWFISVTPWIIGIPLIVFAFVIWKKRRRARS